MLTCTNSSHIDENGPAPGVNVFKINPSEVWYMVNAPLSIPPTT